MVFLREKTFFIAFLLVFGLISAWFGAASSAGAESSSGAGLFPDRNFMRRFCDAPDEARVTVSSDKLFVKPGDDFNLTFSVGNIANVYDYQINLPLASLVAPENSPPWLEGNFFEGKSYSVTDNYSNGNSVVFASKLSGSDRPVTVGPDSTKTLGSICLQAGSQDGDFNVSLPNEAVLFFDDPGENRIAYQADPFNVVIDGTAPVIELDPEIPDLVNANPDGTGSITVSGAVYEENLDCILVNGAPAEFAADGEGVSFSSEVVLQEGLNTIEVRAADKSENSACIIREVTLILPQIAAPVATPGPGIFNGGVWVKLSTESQGASIYYTADGTDPTSQGSLYTGRILIENTTIIKAVAVTGAGHSDTAEFDYIISSSGANDQYINLMALELVMLYGSMDDTDRAAFEAAKDNLINSELDWNQILTPLLDNLTVEAKDAIGGDPAAELRSFFLDGLNIYYSPTGDVAKLTGDLKIFRNTYRPLVTRVLGPDLTVEKIVGFMLDVQNELPNQLTQYDLTGLLDKDFNYIAGVLQDMLDGAVAATLKSPDYEDLKDKLLQVGLTADALIQAKDNIINAAEGESLNGEKALLKAYIRSRIEVAGKRILTVDQTETYQLNILGIDLAPLLKWDGSNPAAAEFEGGSALIKAKAVGTTTVTAYWNTMNGLEKYWLAKFTVQIIEGQTGTIRGKVTKSGDIPFQNAEVMLWQENQLIQEDVTDQDGVFIFNEVIPGNYDLVAFYPGFLKFTTNIQVSSGDNLYFEMKLAQTDSSDLDGNGIVDDKDLQIFMNFYWQMKEQDLWDSNFDFNKDGKIDILDLSALGKSFGYNFTAM